MIKDGPTIYDSGDTAYFKDMETIGEEYPIDLALLNIGGHFGMEPRMAAKAAKVCWRETRHSATLRNVSRDCRECRQLCRRAQNDEHSVS